MDHKQRRKFRELLPDEGESDLNTFLELAGAMPAGLIPQAARVARRSRRPTLRPRALVALASRLSGSERESLLNIALIDVREIEPPPTRVSVLAELAPHLSLESLRRSLAIVGEIEAETLRGTALISLAPHLDERLLDQALAVTLEIEQEYPRWQTLVGLAPHLNEPLLERALAAVGALQNERWRADALVSLTPHLPETLKPRALELALRIGAEEERGWALGLLTRHLPQALIEKVLAAAREMREPKARAEVLEAVTLNLTDPRRRLAVAREIGVEAYRVRALVFITRGLPEELLPEVFYFVSSADDEHWKTWALVNLSSLLPKSWVEPITRVALELVSPEYRAWLLTRLLSRADEHLRSLILSEALASTRRIKDQASRVERYIFLLEEVLPPVREEILREALASARSIGLAEIRCRLIGRLSEYCSDHLRAEVQHSALEAARSVEEVSSRAYALAQVVRYLPTALQQSAFAAAVEITEGQWRSRALADMARTLSDELLPGLVAEVRRMTRSEDRLKVLAELEDRVPGLLTESELLSARTFKGMTMLAAPEAVEGTPTTGGRLNDFLSSLPEGDRGSLILEGYNRLLSSSSRQAIARSVSESRTFEMAPLEELQHVPARTVSNGFAHLSAPDSPIDRMMPLTRGEEYYFWIEIGSPVQGSIAERPETIPLELLPREAELKAALFTIGGGANVAEVIQIRPGADLAEFKVREDGSVAVARQPAGAPQDLPGSDLLSRRIFFLVRMPRRAGTYRLRCCIYFEGTLVQSWLIRARVMLRPRPAKEPALGSRADFTLSGTLAPAHLAQLRPHRLSLMLNSNGGATHAFLFGGEGGRDFKSEVSIDAQQLQHYINIARHAMRKVSWDSDEEFDPNNALHRYRYGSPLAGTLAPDLARLAAAGYSIYSSLFDELAGGKGKELEDLLRQPGRVQIALKESPRFIIPAAILYDYAFDSNAYSFAEYKLCPTFAAALRASAPLEDCPCFKGLCPIRTEIDAISADPKRLIEELGPVICPSGFWGYRHSLGLPPSAGATVDAPQEILFEQAPSISVGVTTDPNFKRRLLHQSKLETIRVPLDWNPPAEGRPAVLRMLRTTKSHLIYFFCHGGVIYPDRIPFIQVGFNERGITPSNLVSNYIYWDNPHPLVFINGCHTTALEPELAIQFVNFFIKKAGAAGVIGTEITIFEQLACDFAEECLQQFLDGVAIGDAVRHARLTLLKAGNPLGLVYIPYVATSLTLKQRPTS
jgi:hypothetical protein